MNRGNKARESQETQEGALIPPTGASGGKSEYADAFFVCVRLTSDGSLARAVSGRVPLRAVKVALGLF